MSYLGIDYGTKRIGVAFSSEDNSLAFPLKIVAAGNGAVGEIAAIARERGAGEIVVGESNDFAGKPNAVMKEIHAFAEALKAEGFVVTFEPEFLTSAAALRGQEAVEKHLDASAAALILQSFLDRMKNHG